MGNYQIALFGEAERGAFSTPHFCRDLCHLVDLFGEPPPESRGLFFAVQALLYQRDVIFFRVEEEGFSPRDYLGGLQNLQNEWADTDLAAVCAPGVGDLDLINAFIPFCQRNHSVLITTEADLYDYLTAK